MLQSVSFSLLSSLISFQLLVDDSREKCSENNYFNCIHPLPYENPTAGDDKNDNSEISKYGAQNGDVITMDKVSDGEEESDENLDNELEPSGRLWTYLTTLSSCFKDGEVTLGLDSDMCNQNEEQSGKKDSVIDCTGDSLNGDKVDMVKKPVSSVCLAALVKAKGQYMCRTA